MMSREPSWVKFIVVLEDGSTHPMHIDASILRSGDDIAQAIAEARQHGGRIPPGNIVTVRRARSDE
jgi:hypothetical protein